MTVKLDSSGIQSVIGEPKFGDLKFTPEEIKDKILKLVEQNKEVFINGKTLHQAFTDMSRSVDDQQVPAEEILQKIHIYHHSHLYQAVVGIPLLVRVEVLFLLRARLVMKSLKSLMDTLTTTTINKKCTKIMRKSMNKKD